MAKRKHKKNKNQIAPKVSPALVPPQRDLIANPLQTLPAAPYAGQEKPLQTVPSAKTKSAISVPLFFSGMFLTLVLGIYIGTLLPEILHKQNSNVPGQAAEVKLPDVSDQIQTQQSPAAEESEMRPDIAANVAHLKANLNENPDSVKDWIELGDLYFDANLPKLSIEAYGRALALNPSNPDVLTDMGIMYRELGEFTAALECFRNANSINPAHTQSLYNEGLILSHDLNDRAGAREAWSKLVKINPNAISPHGKTVSQMLKELE